MSNLHPGPWRRRTGPIKCIQERSCSAWLITRMRPAQMRRDPSSPAVTHRNAPKPPLFRRRAPEMRLCQRRLPLTGWRDCLSLINTAPQPTLVPRRKPDAMRAAMIDKAHTNDPRPPAEDQDPGQGSKKDGGLAAEPVDPRILTIARAIGRLIARERFEELTDPFRHMNR